MMDNEGESYSKQYVSIAVGYGYLAGVISGLVLSAFGLLIYWLIWG